MGFEVINTLATRDEGIDLILSKNNRKSVVQCKRFKGMVGQSVLRDLYGAMIHNRAEDAFVITTGSFSLPAQTWAANKPIHLVDGKMLIEWLESILENTSKLM
jgi:restriction system protein